MKRKSAGGEQASAQVRVRVESDSLFKLTALCSFPGPLSSKKDARPQNTLRCLLPLTPATPRRRKMGLELSLDIGKPLNLLVTSQ